MKLSVPSTLEAELAARFHQARRQGLRTLVELALECGGVLLDARTQLRGRFRAFLKEQLRLERSTAGNYMALAEMARSSPALVERHKDLGVSKLYQLARLAPAARGAVLAEPGVAAMNDRDFQALVAPHRQKTRRVTGVMRARGMGERVRSLSKRIDGWRPGRIAEGEARQELVDDLKDLRRTLDALLERLG